MGERLVFDIETDGFLEHLTKIHSLVIYDPDREVMDSYADQPGFLPIRQGVERLMNAGLVIGHNIIKFDIPAIQKIYPWFEIPEDRVFDTLVATRVIWSDIKELDFKRAKSPKFQFPKKLIGQHGLKAWGYRMGVLKGTYLEENDFENWTPELQSYCERDVEVNDRLLRQIDKARAAWDWEQCLQLEHRFAHILWLMEQRGFCFDVAAAQSLYVDLAGEREELRQELVDLFEPWYVGKSTFVPKRDNKKMGYTAGVELTKIELTHFDPGSRKKVGDRLQNVRGWVPKQDQWTKGGDPKIDDEILGTLKYPEAPQLARFYMLTKLLGQLAEGDRAWIKLERNGRIHGSVNPNGAVTGRCTHAAPNVAQVPSSRKPYGKECRGLFKASPGMVLVGADAEGLELRGLAHFMALWDKGAYAKTVVEGKKEDGSDAHSVNQGVAGLPTREHAKTFIYALIYGAQDLKLGSIVGKGRKAGTQMRSKTMKGLPALGKLSEAVADRVALNGYLVGLDGRKLNVRSKHSALNTLLQSAGALVMKLATVLLYDDLTERGYVFGPDWALVAHVHDEFQIECRKEIADEIGRAACEAITRAGEFFEFKCPLAGSYDIGETWADTH